MLADVFSSCFALLPRRSLSLVLEFVGFNLGAEASKQASTSKQASKQAKTSTKRSSPSPPAKAARKLTKRSQLKPPRRRRVAPSRGFSRMSGLAVSMLLLPRSWWFLFFLVLLLRLRLQCLLRSSRYCFACLACSSGCSLWRAVLASSLVSRASRSSIARFF